MKTTRMTNLLAASAITATLVTLTSCRVENIAGFESVFEDVTGSASTSMANHLASAVNQNGSSTEDFKEGFKAGYAAGYEEAAKLAVASRGCSDPKCDGCDHQHGEAEDLVWRKPAATQTPRYSPNNTGSYPATSSGSSSRSGSARPKSNSSRCAGGS